jgi:mono/diheme cytochrome c family protein
VTPAMVSAARGVSAETLNEGRRIFAGPCTACHAADPVSKYSLAEWRTAVDEMAPRAKLDPSRRAALFAYITAAKAADATRSTH